MRKRMLDAVLATAAVLAPTAAIVLVNLALPAPAVAQESPAIGTWTGKLPVGGAGLTLVFHIAADSAGGLRGTLDSPDQGATGIPIDEVTLTGDSLAVRIRALGVVYNAKLSDDHSRFSGSFQQSGVTIPLEVAKGTAPPGEARPNAPIPGWVAARFGTQR